MSANADVEAEAEEVLTVLAAFGGGGFRGLPYHDKNMVRGRALSRLRDAHREEYERYCHLEAAKLISSGEVRDR